MSEAVRLAVRLGQYVVASPSCWIWTGWRNNRGYGMTYVRGKKVLAHRAIYELLVGPIPEGLELDHLCRMPTCVNPAHLEPVSHGENLRRGRSHWREKTHCPSGHTYDEANTLITRRGARDCRACERGRAPARYQQRKEWYRQWHLKRKARV